MLRRRLGRYLVFKREFVREILEGRKRTTIRRGIVEPNYRRVFLVSEGKIHGELEITSVRHLRVSMLGDEEARNDGFNDRKELLKALKRIYPDIKPDDWVTVVEFRLARRYRGVTAPSVTGRERTAGDKGDEAMVARLALAYDLAKSLYERRVLALVSVKGVRGALEDLPNVSEAQVRLMIDRFRRLLARLNLL